MDAKITEKKVAMLEGLVQEKLNFVDEYIQQGDSVDYTSCEMTFVLYKIAELRLVLEVLTEELNKTRRFIKEHVQLKEDDIC